MHLYDGANETRIKKELNRTSVAEKITSALVWFNRNNMHNIQKTPNLKYNLYMGLFHAQPDKKKQREKNT